MIEWIRENKLFIQLILSITTGDSLLHTHTHKLIFSVADRIDEIRRKWYNELEEDKLFIHSILSITRDHSLLHKQHYSLL